MTVRTRQWLKDNWWGQDPRIHFEDLVDSLDNIVDSGTGAHIWISPQGDDTNGIGSYLNPYATVEQGLSQVSAAKLTVLAMPGTYLENVEWPARSNVRLIGLGKQGAVTLDDASAGGTAVLKVYPATVLASFAGYLDNVTIDHNGTGLKLDNSSAAGTFALYLRDVDFVATGGTSMITNHGTNNPVVIDARHVDFGGEVNLQVRDKNDAFYLHGGKLTGGMVTSGSPALGGTAEITVAHSEIKHEGVSGGSANQKFNSVYSWTRTSKTLALVGTADLAGSHTRNIIGS